MSVSDVDIRLLQPMGTIRQSRNAHVFTTPMHASDRLRPIRHNRLLSIDSVVPAKALITVYV